MEPKVISAIASNLEIVRKVVEDRDESTKKTLHDILVGEDVGTIVSSFISKMDEINDTVVELKSEMGVVSKVIRKSNELMGKGEDGINRISNLLENMSSEFINIKENINSAFSDNVDTIVTSISDNMSNLNKETVEIKNCVVSMFDVMKHHNEIMERKNNDDIINSIETVSDDISGVKTLLKDFVKSELFEKVMSGFEGKIGVISMNSGEIKTGINNMFDLLKKQVDIIESKGNDALETILMIISSHVSNIEKLFKKIITIKDIKKLLSKYEGKIDDISSNTGDISKTFEQTLREIKAIRNIISKQTNKDIVECVGVVAAQLTEMYSLMEENVSKYDVKGSISDLIDVNKDVNEDIKEIKKTVVSILDFIKVQNEKSNQGSDDSKLIDILTEISTNVAAILKKETASPQSPEVQKMLKDVLGDVSNDKDVQLLLAASLISTDLVKNLAQISSFEKDAKKGIDVLHVILFGDDDGLISILKKLKEHEDDIASDKDIEKQVKTLLVTVNIVKELAGIEKLKKSAKKGMKVLQDILFGSEGTDILGMKFGANEGLVGILAKLKKYEDKISSDKDIEKQVKTLLSVIKLVRDISDISKLEKQARKGIKTLDSLIFGSGKKKGLIDILKKLKENEKNISGDKDIQKEIKTLESIVSLVKQLAAISFLGKLSRMGVKTLDGVIFGKGKNQGLLGIFKKLSKESKKLKSTSKHIKEIAGCTKQLVTVALLMTGMIVLAIPATLGVLATTAFVWGFLKLNNLLNRNRKNIAKGSFVMKELMLGLLFMGAAMVLMFKAVRDVTWEEFGMVAATVTILSGVVVAMSVLSKSIERGTRVMAFMGLGFLGMGLSMVLMYKAVKDVDWKDFFVLAATVTVLSGVVVLMSIFSKNIDKGTAAMVVMGVGYITLGLSMFILFNTVKNVEWSQFAMVAATTTVLIGIVALVSTFAKNLEKGTAALIFMGIGYVSLGLSMLLLFTTVKNVEWKQFAIMGATVVTLIGVVALASTFSRNLEIGTKALVEMSIGYILMGVSMMIMYKSVENADWDQFAKVAATVVVLAGVVVLMGLMSKLIQKGSMVMIEMGVGYVLLGISMMLMYKAVEKASWEKFGMLVATVGSLAAMTALMGIPVVAGLIALGSVAMGIMGIGLIALAGGVYLFNLLVTDSAVDKVSEGIPRIFEAITSIFKSDKENPSFGDGLMGIVIGALKVGGAIFAAGALILIGISLGILAICLKPWENFNMKSIDNFEYAYSKIEKIFHLDQGGEGKGLSDIGSGIVGLALAALNFGKTFFQMGTVLIVVFSMSMMYKSLMKWKDFDMKSIENFENAYTKIKEIFKLEDAGTGGITGIVGDMLGLVSAALSFGKTLLQMGTILLCVYTMELVYKNIQIWKDYNPTVMDNFESAYSKMREIFKLDEQENAGIGGILSGAADMASALLGAGKTFFQMGTILMAVKTMEEVYKGIQIWKDYDSATITNFETAYTSIRKIFKLDDEKKKGIGGFLSGLAGMATSALGAGEMFFQMGTILMAVNTMQEVYNGIQVWSNFNPSIIDNFESAYTRLNSIFDLDGKKKTKAIKLRGMEKAKDMYGFLGVISSAESEQFQMMSVILSSVITMYHAAETLKMFAGENMLSAVDVFGQAYTKMQEIFSNVDVDKPADAKKLKGMGKGNIYKFLEALSKTESAHYQYLATMLASVIAMKEAVETLHKIDEIDALAAINNFGECYVKMQEIFKNVDTSPKEATKLRDMHEAHDIYTFLFSLSKTDGAHYQYLATMLASVIAMKEAVETLQKIEGINVDTALTNFEKAYLRMQDTFKNVDANPKDAVKLRDMHEADNIYKFLFSLSKTESAHYQYLATMLASVIAIKEAVETLQKIENIDVDKALTNFETAYSRMIKIFNSVDNGKDGATKLKDMHEADNIYKFLFSLSKTDSNHYQMLAAMLASVIAINHAFELLEKIQKLDVVTSIDNFRYAYTEIKKIFFVGKDKVDGGEVKLNNMDKAKNVYSFLYSLSSTNNYAYQKMAMVLASSIVMLNVVEVLSKMKDINNIKGIVDSFTEIYSKLQGLFSSGNAFTQTKSASLAGIANIKDDDDNRLIGILSQAGGEFTKMAQILTSTMIMKRVYLNLLIWKEFDFNSLSNFSTTLLTMGNVMALFQLKQFDILVEKKIDSIKYVSDTCSKIIKDITRIEQDIYRFDSLMNIIVDSFNKWDDIKYESKASSMSKSLSVLFSTVQKPGSKYKRNIDLTVKLVNTLKVLEKIKPNKVSEPFSKVVDNVNRVEIDKAQALTDMFNSFASLKEKSIFSSFDETVKKFTEACIKLVDAINGNTDALNNEDRDDEDPNKDNNTTPNNVVKKKPINTDKKSTSVNITNIDELAQAIAQRMGGGRGIAGGAISRIDIRVNDTRGKAFKVEPTVV